MVMVMFFRVREAVSARVVGRPESTAVRQAGPAAAESGRRALPH